MKVFGIYYDNCKTNYAHNGYLMHNHIYFNIENANDNAEVLRATPEINNYPHKYSVIELPVKVNKEKVKSNGEILMLIGAMKDIMIKNDPTALSQMIFIQSKMEEWAKKNILPELETGG